MVMSCAMGDVLRDRLPALWRRIEDAHYSYLETDDSPEKLQQKKKLQDYILEYLTLVPHECKFGLSETGKIFQKTINELPDFSAYRAGLGWAALERYAANLLAQPWRKEYRVIRLYCGYFKHEVEANLVGAELLLQAMGYKSVGAGRLQLDAPICPDMVAAVSRDAIIAQCECQIMCDMWEAAWNNGSRTSWRAVARQRADRAGPATRDYDSNEIYSNIPTTITDSYPTRIPDPRYPPTQCSHMCDDVTEENITPLIHPYMVPPVVPPVMFPIADLPVTLPQCSSVPLMTAYGVPFYYPVQTPYMIPTPVYAPIKQAATVPINGYPMPLYRYPVGPSVPTGQLIELDTPSVYENGKFERHDDERTYKKRQLESKRHSTSKSNLISSSDVSLPSLPRSDTQPVLSKAKEDGMGTYESWDYVFRNLSSKDQEKESRSRFSPSLDRDSRTLDRLDREERRAKYQPTTLDLEDGLQALNLDRTYDEDVYRTAKVNENLMRLKQEKELKSAKHLAKKNSEERRKKEPIGNPPSDALITSKVAQDKMKLLSKKDIKDRKEVLKHQNSVNGSVTSDVKKVKKPAKLVPEVEKTRSKENGVHAHSSKTVSSSSSGSSAHHSKHDLKAQLVVSLDEPDAVRRSPPKPTQNGDRPPSRTSVHKDKWECATCTYLNKTSVQACEMCGKSKRGPEIQPLRSGGRECPACTLVNERSAAQCDACGTSLQHCPTYI